MREKGRYAQKSVRNRYFRNYWGGSYSLPEKNGRRRAGCVEAFGRVSTRVWGALGLISSTGLKKEREKERTLCLSCWKTKDRLSGVWFLRQSCCSQWPWSRRLILSMCASESSVGWQSHCLPTDTTQLLLSTWFWIWTQGAKFRKWVSTPPHHKLRVFPSTPRIHK